jgi:hypothetical protein
MMSLDMYLRDRHEVNGLNVTHNLGKMASHVIVRHITIDNPMDSVLTLYDLTWNFVESDYKVGSDISESLYRAIRYMVAHKKQLLKYDSQNGWGTYDGLLNFTIGLLEITLRYPDEIIEVSK